jgi:ketosteroid isomerase-like protein
MTADSIAELFARRRRAWASRDVASLAATYTDDCTVETPIFGTLTGPSAVERAERDLLAAMPDLALESEDLLIAGDRAIVTATATGTDQAGTLTSPGTPLRFPVVVLYTLRDNLIASERRIWDFSGFLLERVQRDLTTAAEIQQRLFPQRSLARDEFEIAAASIPCRTIGGDFFDYYDLPDGRFALAVGDVAGKGPPAALLSASLQAILGAYPQAGGPASTLTFANRALLRRPVPARFVTLVHATLSKSGALTYSNAGHNAPLIVGANGRRWLRKGGMVLGLFDEATYEEETLQLDPGDRLVAYSDGITEALNADGEEFGEERLVSCVETHRRLTPAALVERLLETVQQFAHGTSQRDDLTVLVLSQGDTRTTA